MVQLTAVNNYVIILIILTLLNFIGHCHRVFEKIYEEIQGDMACFRRFNGTHEIGCSSEFWGNVGIVHLVQEKSDLEWFLYNGTHPPYILALIPPYFNLEVVNSAAKSGKLSGIVLLHSKNFTIPSSFSGEQTCPNSQSSFYKNTTFSQSCERNPWNPDGSSMLLKSWNFPIFYIDDEDSINSIISCYVKFNKPINGVSRDWPLCALELQSSMYAATNSEVCLRRSQSSMSPPNENLCHPLEDINVWTTIKPLNGTDLMNNSMIIVSTSTDASSIFDNISPGAESAVSGLVTLLVTAKALYKYVDELGESSKNIMFTLFEGEAWDYIGSSRMVFDMKKGQFPNEYIDGQSDQMSKLNLSHIDSVIDLRQLGLLNDQGIKRLYIHSDPLSNTEEDVKNKTRILSDIVIAESYEWNIEVETVDGVLPPSSFQSILKERFVPGIVLADHANPFKNKYYESIYDTYDNLQYKFHPNGTDDEDVLHKDLTDVASMLASSLFRLLTGKRKKIIADAQTTNQLLYCYLVNTNCSLFREYSDESIIKYLSPKPAKMYVSARRGEAHLSYLTGRILSYFMGELINLNETDCTSNNSQILNLDYFPFKDNGSCVRSTSHYTSALSPAFIIDHYDWGSAEYSSWTESTWTKTAARIFLRPSPLEEIGILICGIISVLLSICTVYLLNSRASLIFVGEVQPAQC